MAIKTRNELKTQIDAGIKVNGNREITPPIHNSIETNIIDSFLNFKDGGNKVESLSGYISELTLTDRKNFTHKGYVDDAITAATGGLGGSFLRLDGTNGPMQGNVNWGGFNINNISAVSRGTSSLSFGTDTIDLLTSLNQISLSSSGINIISPTNLITLSESVGSEGITIYSGLGKIDMTSNTDLNLTATNNLLLTGDTSQLISNVGNIQITSADSIEISSNGDYVDVNGLLAAYLGHQGGAYVGVESGNGITLTSAGENFYVVGGATGEFFSNTLSFNITTISGMLYTDSSGTNGGIKYASDYSSSFTSRSLVDKAYVDNAIASGGGTFQAIYNASSQPQLLINDTKGSLILQSARSVNSSIIFETKNIAGTTMFSIDGDGIVKVNDLYILDFDGITPKLALSGNNNTNLLSVGTGFTTVFIPLSTASTSANTGALRVTGGSALNGTVNIGSSIFGSVGILNACISSGGAISIPATFQGNGTSNKIYVWNTGTGATLRATEITFIQANDAGSSATRGTIFNQYVSAVAGQETTNTAIQVSSFGTVGTVLALNGTQTAIAINYIQIQNNSAGLNPTYSAQGGDANIGLAFASKGRVSNSSGFTFRGDTTNSAQSSTATFSNILDAAGDATIAHYNGTASSTSNRSVLRLVQNSSNGSANCNTYLWAKATTTTATSEVTQFGVDVMIAGVRTTVLTLDGTNGLTSLTTNTRVNDLYILDFDNATYKVALDSPSLNTLRIGQQFTNLSISGTTTTFLTTNAVFSLNLPGGPASTGLGFRFGRQSTLSHTTGTAIQISSSGSYVVASGNGNFTLFNVDCAVNQTGGTGVITGVDIFSIPFSNITGSVYGLRSRVSSTIAGGSIDLWNLYIDGTASNFFGGTVQLQTSSLGNTLLQYTSITGGTTNAIVNILQNRVLTTNATVTTLHSFATATDINYYLEVKVSARRTGGSSGAVGDSGIMIGTIRVKNVGGTLIIMNNFVDNSSADQAWTIGWATSGTSILLQVTGSLNNNITWMMTEAKIFTAGG